MEKLCSTWKGVFFPLPISLSWFVQLWKKLTLLIPPVRCNFAHSGGTFETQPQASQESLLSNGFFPLKKISNGFPSHKSDSIQVWKIPTWWKMKYLWNNTKTLKCERSIKEIWNKVIEETEKDNTIIWQQIWHSASSSQACFFENDMFSRGKICVRKLSFWKCLTLCILYFHICILWYLSTSPDTHCSILFLSFEQKIWLFIFCSSPIGTFIKACINSNSTSFVVSTFP